jgi:hypothetical protein
MRRCGLTCNFLGSAALVCSVCASAAELHLPETIPAPGNNMVLVRLLETGRANPLSEGERRGLLEVAPTRDHRFIAALKSIEQAGANRFFLYEFVLWPAGNTQEVYQARYSVSSTGTFEDFNKEVPFRVRAGSGESEGTMTLPVHPVNPAASCTLVRAPSETAPLAVALTGETTYTLELECGTVGFLPRIIEIRDPEVANPSRWKSVRWESRYGGAAASTVQVRSRRFALMTLYLEPHTLSAIGARFLRFASRDATDDHISIDFTYAMRPGGMDVPVNLELPVAFVPSLSVMAGFLSFGLAAGWVGAVLLSVLTGSRPEPRRALTSLMLGLIVAVLALVAGVLAYGLNCRLQVFGFDLNPFDMLVQMLTGAAAGVLCVLYADQLKKFLDSLLDKIKGGAKVTPAVYICLAFASGALGAQPSLELVGLAACPDGLVVGIGRDGSVLRFADDQGDARPVGRLHSAYNPTEIACVSIQGRTTALVTASVLKNVLVLGVDVGSGRWAELGSARGASAGVAYDSKTNSAFFSSPVDQSIYRLEISPLERGAEVRSGGRKTAQAWVSIYGGSVSLGPVAVDSRRRRLLVSDAFSGVLYSVDLETRRQSRFAESFGVINSLSVDEARETLYVADSGKRSVWSLLLREGAPKPVLFVQDAGFQGLTGVAADAKGQVWVSVITSREVRLYDRSRQLLKRFK